MSEKFSVGALVWAKKKGFSYWPGVVCSPREGNKKPEEGKATVCVCFFGMSRYCDYIAETQILEYESNKSRLMKASRSATFRDALDEIEKYIQRSKDDPNFGVDLFISDGC